ncbi:autotransporter outer membrane beta-barrel domain-containing protein [Methyloferula stellata]|uniref:autotransporter outer membrane beta-barrel domain-containing protein n=1 Tax=Methyloferula stellata TaxID=876270 RepID=UPI0003A04319|nr:autotransporter domain-containing protein [Methyloferula stellata]
MKKSLPASVIVRGLPDASGARARRSASACGFRMMLALCGFGAVLLPTSYARAACLPAGSIVTCTGTTTNQDAPNGFGTGAETGITINLQPTAPLPAPVVSGDATGIFIADGTVNIPVSGTVTSPGIGIEATSGTLNLTNSGVVSGTGPVGSGSIGISGGTLNITNAATGTISGGDFGIVGGDNGTIVNAGTISGARAITLGSDNSISNSGTVIAADGGFGSGVGIFALSNNIITNSGKILLGNSDTGIVVVGGHNAITNNGTITDYGAGSAIIGVELGVSSHNHFTNNGSILVGDTSVGVDGSSSAFSTIVNNGTIVTGSATFGVSFGIGAGYQGRVTNNGTITVGNDAFGIVVGGGGNATIVNNGTIIAGDGVLDYSAGIDASFLGQNNVTNNGRITVGANGIGINTGDSNTITNNGTIVAGANGISIGHCICVVSTNNIVNNNGTLDGRIYLDSGGGPGNTFLNAGLITITDTGTPVGANHIIDGTFTQTASGTLALRVNNAAVSDVLSNSGAGTLTATLGGRLGAVVQPGLYANSTTYIGVVSATDPITTQFSQVQAFAAGTTAPLAFFTATATYNPTSVDLTLTRIGFGAVPGETFNERAVGNALNALYSTGLTGNQALFFSDLLQATSAGVLDQLSGEGTSATQQTAFSAAETFLTSMMDQGNFWLSGGTLDTNGTSFTAMNYAPSLAQTPVFKAMPGAAPIFEQHWRAWTAGFDTASSVNADISTGAASSSFRTAGGVAGFDVQVTPDLLLGAAAGGSASNFSVDARATSGRLDGAHVGIYGVARNGPWYAQGALGYANFDTTTTRTVAGVGAAEILNGHFNSNLFNGRFEGGYRQVFGNVAVTPFAAIEFAELWQPGYGETNPTFSAAPLGLFGLSYAARTTSSLPTFLGAQFDARSELPNGWIVSPYLRLSWVHEFEPNRNIAASFIVLPGSDFSVNGPRAAADAARINAGIRLAVAHNISLFASVTGEFSDRSDMYAGKGGLKVYW